jgi:hypothetical protein
MYDDGYYTPFLFPVNNNVMIRKCRAPITPDVRILLNKIFFNISTSPADINSQKGIVWCEEYTRARVV